MRFRISLTVDIERAEPTEAHDTFESQGALVESVAQPRYAGFNIEQGVGG